MLEDWTRAANNAEFTMKVSPEAFSGLLDAYLAQNDLSDPEVGAIKRLGIPSGMFMIRPEEGLSGEDARIYPENTTPTPMALVVTEESLPVTARAGGG